MHFFVIYIFICILFFNSEFKHIGGDLDKLEYHHLMMDKT